MRTRQRVLIVDDDNDLRGLYRTALTLAGYQVFEANSGFAALQRVDGARFDLIILDLLLPGIDGFSVYRDLMAQPHLRDVPIVIITGSDRATHQMRVAASLRKPVPLKHLVETVRVCLEAHPETH